MDLVALAWHTAAMVRMKHLQPLNHYTDHIRPARRHAPLPPAERAAVVDAAARWKAELARRRKRKEAADGAT